ncbi:MAG TPA: Type 1 glutamine amidotransferase-like domain-containing protein [Candidatus Absconditabacterales bacterium]|nr:Type 1 glutamine amidotransferase-like domain-containing protein [Candidatus Absconditabacterales bacterium]
MKLFLASALDHVKGLFVENIGDINGKGIGFITNPADMDREGDQDPWWVLNDLNMLKSLGGKIKQIDLRETKNEDLFNIVSGCDILYVSGGNTRYFKNLADESGFNKIVDELILTGKIIYISTSAGSCVMGTGIKYLDPGDFKIEKGYGIVSAMILPHWGSEDFKKEYEDTIEKIYQDGQNIISIADTQAILVDNQGYKIIGK